MEVLKMQTACLLIVLLLTVFYMKSRHLKTRSSKCFRIMLWTAAVHLCFDMLAVYTVNYMEPFCVTCSRFANIISAVTRMLLFGLFLRYIILLIENVIVLAGWVRLIVNVPLFLGTIYIMIWPFEYRASSQGSFPAAIGITLTILTLFLTRENPEDYYDKASGTFNEAGFRKMVYENIRFRERFHVILFTVSNMEIIRERYGGAVANSCARLISDEIYHLFGHNTYALDDNELVFFAGSSEAAQGCMENLKGWFREPMSIGKTQIMIHTEMKAWTFEKNSWKSADDVLYNIGEYFTKVLAKSIYMDHFTGVMNRNAYERDMAHFLCSGSYFEHIWCCILDINNLKRMNDSYGHKAGDALIKGCADILKASLPKDARIYRIGGDEFAVLCFGKEAKQISRIFQDVKRTCAAVNEEVEYPVDFAIGAVEYNPEADASLFEAFARADKEMYRDKEEMHRREKRAQSQDDWNWIRNLDSVTYESILFRSACEITDSYLFIENKVTNMTRWSPNAVDDFELSGEYIFQGLKRWASLVHPEDKGQFEETAVKLSYGQRRLCQRIYRVKNRWGEYIGVEECSYLSCDENGKGRILIGLIHLAQQDNQRDLETGLLNKYEFSKRVKQLSGRHSISTGILLIGINHFRKINTIYSYAVGDEVLRIIAEQIQRNSPLKSSQYRYGGDMFAVIYPHCRKEDICYLFENIEKAVQCIVIESGESIYLTISGGAVMLEEDMSGDSIKNSLEHAWMNAKKVGGSILEFASGSQMLESVTKLRMREMLRQCVKQQMSGFYLNFQPIFHGNGRELFGCEALLRWNNSNFEKIGTEQFIAIFEENGLIKEVGRWVITNALEQLKKWRRLKPDMSININISYVQLGQPDLGSFIVNELERLILPPESIVIEMTESCKISNFDGVLEFVRYLKEHRIAFGLDDFGTGYSSFEVLKKVPADWIKLEHNYVSSYQKSLVDRKIITHTIGLCHSLGIKVCAEGIEDEDCCENMKSWKVEYLQGYYFSRPLPAEKFEEEFLSDEIRRNHKTDN